MEIINYENKVEQVKMQNIIYHGALPDSQHIVVGLYLLDACNYKCSYCFSHDRDFSNEKFVTLDKLKHAVDQIFKIKKSYYKFSILGGEVTYHPHFLELIEYIYSFKKEKNLLIEIISNASKDISYFKKLLEYSSDSNFYLSFSVHFEYAKLEHIKDLIILFNEYNKPIDINFMLHPEYEDKVKEYFNEVIKLREKYYFTFTLSELREPPDFNNTDRRYTKEFFEWINNARKEIENVVSNSNVKEIKITNWKHENIHFKIKDKDTIKSIYLDKDIALRYNLKRFKNFYCCGGLNYIIVNPDGSYQGATCSEFPIVGNLYEDDIDFYKLSKFVRCNLEQCGCHGNDVIFKYRDLNDAQKQVYNYRFQQPELILEGLLNTENENQNKFNKLIDTLAWWIPFKKKREEFIAKFK